MERKWTCGPARSLTSPSSTTRTQTWGMKWKERWNPDRTPTVWCLSSLKSALRFVNILFSATFFSSPSCVKADVESQRRHLVDSWLRKEIRKQNTTQEKPCHASYREDDYLKVVIEKHWDHIVKEHKCGWPDSHAASVISTPRFHHATFLPNKHSRVHDISVLSVSCAGMRKPNLTQAAGC